MGKHSNKKPKKVQSLTTLLDGVTELNKHAEVQTGPPQAIDATPSVDGFNLQHGNLAGLHRIVKRRKLKDRVNLLETIIKVHIPLTHALRVTQKAFQDGVMEGIRQVAAAERERETNSAKPEVPLAERSATAVPPTIVSEEAVPFEAPIVTHNDACSADPHAAL